MTVTNGINVTPTDAFAEIVVSRPVEGDWMGALQRRALVDALSGLDRETTFVLLRSADRHWARYPDGGPDLPGEDDAATPTLADLCLAIDASPVPVCILLEGLVCGAGAELAIAAQARVATSAARIVFSAARLGRISGAGSTQRLPLAVGSEQALRLLIDARPVPAPEALAIGLVDTVVEGETAADCVAAARAWAQRHALRSPRERGGQDGRSFLRAVKAVRATASEGSLAMALADCAEAALLLPLAQGLAFEATLAAERDSLPQTGALAHLIRAERSAAQIPEALQGVTPAPVTCPTWVGASPQGTALALMALVRGMPVQIWEPDRARLVALLQSIAARQEAAVQSGALTAAKRDADWSRLRTFSDATVLEGADLVLVAAETPLPPVRAQVPLLVMGRGELPAGAFRLTISGRVAELGLPQPWSAAAAAQSLAFLRRLGQIVILTAQPSGPGIASRLAGAGGAALRAMHASGVRDEAILAALTEFGVASPRLPKTDARPEPRDMAPEEITRRWLAALANEGTRLLAEGVAQSAADIDLVAIHGLGLPAECGGPMYQADQRGLMILRRDLRLWAAEADVWEPVPALDRLVSVGRGFSAAISPE